MDENYDLSRLCLFTGTEHYHRLNRRCLLTDGAKYLAEGAGAFWLMDAAASYLLELGTSDWFVQVRLVVTGSTAVLTMEDGNGAVRARQVIPYTDFPIPHYTLYACWNGSDWVIMLTSEY
ncbi:DUF6876 family protein [Limnohabitans lacus]|uniref:DUF6876 domain-containing protein n=1 Tax=Limnohabitans lacus TaxID=3045173 RepID=A0ABT6XA60_9BURK|nr:DUF6876 family protein [Limnohabitans sp. HM2-2]MDI9235016.1 hypothetical protein [Limnohabitans sp. HM2-2]